MTTESTTAPLTLSAIEKIRAKGITENESIRLKNTARVESRVDSLIAFLQANRGHIAGIAAVVIPVDETTLVDVETGESSGGLVMRSAIHGGYSDILSVKSEDLVKPRSRNPLAGLLGSLR